MKNDASPLVWIDCEMTGLDATKDHIIEICCLVTDGDLNLLDEVGTCSIRYNLINLTCCVWFGRMGSRQ